MTRSGAEFLRLLAARRSHGVPLRNGRRRRRVRVRPQNQPDAIRRTYYDSLLKITAAAREDVRSVLFSHGPALVAEAAHMRGDSLARMLDSPTSTVAKIMRDVAADFFDEFTDERIAAVIRHFGVEVSDFQRNQIAKQFGRAIGFDPFRLGEPWLEARISDFTTANVSLIRTIPERYFGDIENRLISDLRAGTRWEEIAPDLEDRYGVSESNAERIARDQVGKFYGELNRARQQDVGVTRYVWRTAHDNRVRDSHASLEGTEHEWEGEGDPEEGHPGEAINCRCQGEPDLAQVLDALD